MEFKDKRTIRKLKRAVKRAGNKHERQRISRHLLENPEDAHGLEITFGRYSSARMNGLDHDATRRQPRLKSRG